MNVTHSRVVSGDECGTVLPLQEACAVHEGIGVRKQRMMGVADEVRRANHVITRGEDFTAKSARSEARVEQRHLRPGCGRACDQRTTVNVPRPRSTAAADYLASPSRRESFRTQESNENSMVLNLPR